MLMVDTILEIDNETVSTIFNIKNDNIFIENNRFSEAGLIENIAQTCSSIVGQKIYTNSEDKKVIGFITSLKKIQIFELPLVGSQIITKAVMISKFENICNITCNVFLNEIILAEADISLFIKEL